MCCYNNSVNSMCSGAGGTGAGGTGAGAGGGTGAEASSGNLTYDIFGSDTESVGSLDDDSHNDSVLLTDDYHDDDDDDDNDDDDDDDDDYHDYHDDDDDCVRCPRPYIRCTQYIGLKQLAYILGLAAHRLYETDRIHLAEPMYMDALAIDPYHDFVGNMGIMYEIRFKNFELAKKYYLLAIAEGDELAMYNLADLYCNEKNVELMVQYFELAVQHGDIASRKRLILHYHSVGDMPNFARHYYLQMSCDGDGYGNDDECDYSKFLQSHNSLTLAAQLDRGDTRDHADVVRLLDCLHKTPQHCAFKNKVALFTRLNHVVECGICYDNDKVNIDIHCGHTVCVDCYTHLYDKACPFCRQMPLVA